VCWFHIISQLPTLSTLVQWCRGEHLVQCRGETTGVQRLDLPGRRTERRSPQEVGDCCAVVGHAQQVSTAEEIFCTRLGKSFGTK
jgi:hypothetical protein